MVSRPGRFWRHGVEADAEDARFQVSRNVMAPNANQTPVCSVPEAPRRNAMQLRAVSSGCISRMRDVRAWASRGLLSETGGMSITQRACTGTNYGHDAST